MNKYKDKEVLILDVAMRLFSEKGFSKTSIQDIADCAGIGKGTIYEYFKSKEEVFVEGYANEVDKLIQLIQHVVTEKMNFVEKLDKILRVMQDVADNHARKMRLLLHDSRSELRQTARESLSQLHKNMRKKMRNLILIALKEGVAEEAVEDQNLDFAADFLMDFIFVFTVTSCGIQEFDSTGLNEDKRKKFISLIMNGISKK